MSDKLSHRRVGQDREGLKLIPGVQFGIYSQKDLIRGEKQAAASWGGGGDCRLNRLALLMPRPFFLLSGHSATCAAQFVPIGAVTENDARQSEHERNFTISAKY